MSAPKPVKIKISGKSRSSTWMDVSARQHMLTVDEPEERGGTDQGPLPLETFLASLASCTNVVANIIARDLEFRISDMRIELEADLDNRAIFGVSHVLNPFPFIRMTVELAVSNANRSQIEELKRDLRWRCPVSAVIRASGTEVVEDWRITHLRDEDSGRELSC